MSFSVVRMQGHGIGYWTAGPGSSCAGSITVRPVPRKLYTAVADLRKLPLMNNADRSSASAGQHTRGVGLSLPHWITLTALAFLYPVTIAIAHPAIVYDDPFILMRYSRNLASGFGWNFNPGSATENAVTSPLYMLLTSGGTAIGGSPQSWALWIYVVAWGLGGIVAACVLLLDKRRWGAWIGCGLYSVSPLVANVRGMETSIYVLLILCAILALQRECWIVLGCVLGLVALTRSDGVLIGIVIIAMALFRHRRALIAVILPFAAIEISSIAFLWAITGSPFPSTLAAKLAQRDSGAFGSEWGFLLGLNANGIMGASEASRNTLVVLGYLGLALLAAAIFGTIQSFRRREIALPLITIIGAVVVVEYGLVLRMPASYLWHYAPWTLWATVGAAVGVDELLQRHRRVAASIVTAAALVGAALGFRSAPVEERSHYREVAEWIDQDSRNAHPTVATAEIGAIGYYGRAEIIDYLGLLDPRAIDSVRRSDFTWWLNLKPEYWVSSTGASWEAQTLTLPQFQHEYHAVAHFGSLTVYRRSG